MPMAFTAEEGTLESGGLRLFTRHWPHPAPKATVAIVHGFGEHSGRYAHVARALHDRGYRVFAFDLRGHGKSEGPRAYVQSFDAFLGDVGAYLRWVDAQAPDRPRFLLAHSLGGCISTLFTLRHRPKLAGLVLSGPALKLGEDFSPAKIAAGRFLGRYFPRLPIEKLDSGSVSRDPEVVRAYQADPLVFHGWVRTGFGLAFMAAAEEVGERMEEVDLPLLVLQGAKDRLVNKAGGRELYERARSKDKTLTVYPDLYHEVFNEPERQAVLSDLCAWLDRRVEPRIDDSSKDERPEVGAAQAKGGAAQEERT